MPASIEWFDEERTVAIYNVEGPWTVDDVIEQLQAYIALGESQPLYYIMDMSKANVIPNGLLIRRVDYEPLLQLNEGLTVVVRAPQLLIMVVKLLTRFKVNLHDIIFVDSIAEAEEVISQHK